MKFIASLALVALSRFASAYPCAAHSSSTVSAAPSAATSATISAAGSTYLAASATTTVTAPTKVASSGASSSGPVGYASQNGGYEPLQYDILKHRI